MKDQTSYIPLEQAKAMIVTALDQFDLELAVRAADVLYNEERLNIVEVPKANKRMMMCRPAGVTIEDLKNDSKYIPDFAQKYGPHFVRQDNPTDHAIIDFEYDGTPYSVVWLAHELGHAIADDIQREAGHSFKDFSDAEQEEQAYFLQHIVSQYLKTNLKSHDVTDKSLGQEVSEMSSGRATQYTRAGTVFEAALKNPTKRNSIALRSLDQRRMP